MKGPVVETQIVHIEMTGTLEQCIEWFNGNHRTHVFHDLIKNFNFQLTEGEVDRQLSISVVL
jgi:hypothetical protein